MMPTISIITATYNGGQFLEEAIRSVIEHDYPNIEYIIIDGGSIDNTVEIVKRYRQNIAYFVSEPDRGISDAFNKGIKAATGEIVGIVSADDQLLPGALQAVAAFYERSGCPDVVHGNVIYLDVATGRKSLSRPDATLRTALYGQPVKHGAVFVRKAAYEKHGVFDLRYKCAMDYDLILRMIVAGASFAYLNQALAVLRNGGVNVRLRSLTRTESRDISVRHGCPAWKAAAYYYRKVMKDWGKVWLGRLHLQLLAEAYRRRRGTNSPI